MKEVNSDNKINNKIYEDNIDFSNYSSDIKVIALYLPTFYNMNNNKDTKNPYNYGWKSIQNSIPLFKGHYQPRKPINISKYLGYYDLSFIEVIKKQIQFAKNHGIYGFGIYYYWSFGKILFEKPLRLIFENDDIDFKYCLIWKNDYILYNKNNEKNRLNLIKIENNSDNIKNNTSLIDDIYNYLKDIRYIRINQKPVLGIYKPSIINKIETVIASWREKARENNIGEIFILSNLNDQFFEDIKKMKVFDAAYEYPPFNILSDNLMKNDYYFYYSGLIFRSMNKSYNITNDFPIYRGVMLEWDNSQNLRDNFSIFSDYSPEKFYIINKLLINWTRNNYNDSNKFIIINSWNNWYEGSYLEPDIKNGFANLNSLSKAIFNLPFQAYIYNLSNLKNKTYIAVQVHLFYEDLIKEVTNKINNIPVKFDLYISTNTWNKAKKIENYMRNNSKAENFFIKIMKNKGRDVLPFLTQLKLVIKNYKYICHVHSKKTIYDPEYGQKWRNYLYRNLLGSIEIVSEILSDFENFSKLGLIFPETFYECIVHAIKVKDEDRKYTNYILNKIFPGFKVEKSFDFPAGNMFWARIDAIYQIFDVISEDLFPKEENQQTGTIMHGIERIWIYLVKLNGFSYKKIFKIL